MRDVILRRAAQHGVAVAVSNRGAGIAAERLSRLFQPFQREASDYELPSPSGG